MVARISDRSPVGGGYSGNATARRGDNDPCGSGLQQRRDRGTSLKIGFGSNVEGLNSKEAVKNTSIIPGFSQRTERLLENEGRLEATKD
ncbi:hypothetical protein L1887_14840 [Cichorium endivia]|nr:hypothetical protein L1887_14839 [Cichorium endivia]KAI3515934.1 hypothetical protein L1887_14840 [Cichorium endivia]